MPIHQITSPALPGTSKPGSERSEFELHPSTKRASVLRTLLDRGATGLNCFEAVRVCRDYVLRSTISDLQRQYGLRFRRCDEEVPNAFGGQTDCVRYWLEGAEERKVRALLSGNAHDANTGAWGDDWREDAPRHSAPADRSFWGVPMKPQTIRIFLPGVRGELGQRAQPR